MLRGDDIGNSGEAEVIRFRVRPDKPEPLLSDDEGDEDVRFSKREKLAEVHGGVDVTSAGKRHRHHVAYGGGGWFHGGGSGGCEIW